MAGTMADDEHGHVAYQTSSPNPWSPNPHVYPHSHHGTPAQEYSGFQFTSPPPPLETSAFDPAMHQRQIHQHLQPLVMPQWPSMLNSQSHPPFQQMFPPPTQPIQPIQPIQPMSITPIATPVSAASARSSSTPRKTLTDLDRKRMCQYAEEHPNSKQTDIGGTYDCVFEFGVLSLT